MDHRNDARLLWAGVRGGGHDAPRARMKMVAKNGITQPLRARSTLAAASPIE